MEWLAAINQISLCLTCEHSRVDSDTGQSDLFASFVLLIRLMFGLHEIRGPAEYCLNIVAIVWSLFYKVSSFRTNVCFYSHCITNANMRE